MRGGDADRSGRRSVRRGLALTALALLGLARYVAAQDGDTLRARYQIEAPETVDLLSIVARTAPGSSAGSPTAYGPSWGDAYVGMGFTHRARFMPSRHFLDSADGAVSVGFGLGDARDLVGLDVNVASYSTVKRGLGTRMGLSLKLHRVFPGNWGVAVGWENALKRGPVDSQSSVYVAASHVWQEAPWHPFRSVTATLGAGNARFRLEDDVVADRETVNAFGSVGLQIWDPFSLIADWTGQDLVLGASIVPFQLPYMPADLRAIPLVITPGVADLTGTAGDGPRFIIGAGMGFRWDALGEIFP